MKLPVKLYAEFLEAVKERIRRGRLQAARAVNSELVSLYWDLGQSIYEKQAVQGWGDGVVETLALDLKATFPGTTGFSVASLWRMRQFYIAYSAPAFLAQAVRELVQAVPWGHHTTLLGKLEDSAHVEESKVVTNLTVKMSIRACELGGSAGNLGWARVCAQERKVVNPREAQVLRKANMTPS